MPEGQTTDGQTELQCQCQGLAWAVAELDNVIRKDSKQLESANGNCHLAIPGETLERHDSERQSFLMEMYVPAYCMDCLARGLRGLRILHSL